MLRAPFKRQERRQDCVNIYKPTSLETCRLLMLWHVPNWPGGLMVRRCFPVRRLAKIAGSSPVWIDILLLPLKAVLLSYQSSQTVQEWCCYVELCEGCSFCYC